VKYQLTPDERRTDRLGLLGIAVGHVVLAALAVAGVLAVQWALANFAWLFVTGSALLVGK
jgi:hypothetical protein